MEKTEQSNSWNETIRTIILAVVLAVTVRSFVFEPFYIPSGSMKSNLLIGDYLFVSKYSYGYSRFSFPFGLPLFQGRVLSSNLPERGDVVVFRFPKDTRIDYIKRVMGVPGDTLQMKEGILYINGKPLERKYVDDFSDMENNIVEAIPRYTETLPEGKTITILHENPPTGSDVKEQNKYQMANDSKEFIIPEGKYFMMGDNRDNSSDSRFDVGFVPLENIVGKAQFIWFSTDGSARFFNPISWFTAMRTDRMFTNIE